MEGSVAEWLAAPLLPKKPPVVHYRPVGGRPPQSTRRKLSLVAERSLAGEPLNEEADNRRQLAQTQGIGTLARPTFNYFGAGGGNRTRIFSLGSGRFDRNPLAGLTTGFARGSVDSRSVPAFAKRDAV